MAMIRAKQVAKRLAIGLSTVWYYHKVDPDFPRAIKLGKNVTVWDESEIDVFLESRRQKATA